MTDESTICAIATAPGNGAIAIIRLSGNKAIAITDKILHFTKSSKKLASEKENTIHFATLMDQERILDEVLVSLFRSPHSYTGEDVIEISCHGSVFIQQQIIQLLLKNGARLAQPGEFSLRAFLNGKMDLSQAEAVADLIASQSQASHQMAIRQMRGGVSSELKMLRDQLMQFISLIELELDFSEEDVEFADREQFKDLVQHIMNAVTKLTDSFAVGNALKNGIPVAIIGRPNVGKSTLLNTLLSEEKAIVSEIPGTTRDAIEDTIIIDGIMFRFIDTAGIRHTEDIIENLGIRKTYEKVSIASIVILVVDATDCLSDINMQVEQLKEKMDPDHQKLILVINKIDRVSDEELKAKFGEIIFGSLGENDAMITLSAKNRLKMNMLIDELLKHYRTDGSEVANITINNARHYEALTKSRTALQRLAEGLINKIPGDLLAQDIREVLHYIGTITGEVTTEEILGNIFSKFCIGK
jgi:tRNA modification GTPase